jgi:hypothetical protein
MSSKWEFSHDPATRRVSTSEPRPRHKTASELRAMPHEDALLYQIENPMTDLEKEQALENGQAVAEYEQDGEIPVNSALWDDGPPRPLKGKHAMTTPDNDNTAEYPDHTLPDVPDAEPLTPEPARLPEPEIYNAERHGAPQPQRQPAQRGIPDVNEDPIGHFSARAGAVERHLKPRRGRSDFFTPRTGGYRGRVG